MVDATVNSTRSQLWGMRDFPTPDKSPQWSLTTTTNLRTEETIFPGATMRRENEAVKNEAAMLVRKEGPTKPVEMPDT